MKDVDLKLDRLLRSAALANDDVALEAPFGFAARVVAIWRTQEGAPNGIAQLLRRVALFACAIIVLSAAGAYREFRQTRELDDSFSNKFAIADAAIQDEFSQ
jgi:hypothetical protein